MEVLYHWIFDHPCHIIISVVVVVVLVVVDVAFLCAQTAKIRVAATTIRRGCGGFSGGPYDLLWSDLWRQWMNYNTFPTISCHESVRTSARYKWGMIFFTQVTRAKHPSRNQFSFFPCFALFSGCYVKTSVKNLTSKQKYRFGMARPDKNGTFVLKSTGGFAQPDVSPCIDVPVEKKLKWPNTRNKTVVQCNPLDGSAEKPAKIKAISTLNNYPSAVYLHRKHYKMRQAKSWTINWIKPLSGDSLSGLHCITVSLVVHWPVRRRSPCRRSRRRGCWRGWPTCRAPLPSNSASSAPCPWGTIQQTFFTMGDIFALFGHRSWIDFIDTQVQKWAKRWSLGCESFLPGLAWPLLSRTGQFLGPFQ